MDDARTQRTLDAIADLYLTADAASPRRPGQGLDDSHADSAARPVRLPPKLRIRQSLSAATLPTTGAPSGQPAAAVDSTRPDSPLDVDEGAMALLTSAKHGGPARPWREVRQARRDAWAVHDEADLSATDAAEPSIAGGPGPVVTHAIETSPATPDLATGSAAREGVDASGACEGTSGAGAGGGVLIEAQAVFLGNLPGFGRPWLTQYAQQLARGDGSAVAVIHLDLAQDTLTLDIVTPSADHRLPSLAGQTPLDILATLAHHTPTPVKRWLCHLPLPCDPSPVGLAAESLAMAREVGDWTLLLGGDEAAVMHARQWLVRMASADAHHAARRRLGVAVMGCSPEQSRQVAGTLRQALAGRSAVELALRDARPQMAPVHVQSMGQFSAARMHWPELMALIAACESDHAAARPAMSAGSAVPFALPFDRRLDVQAARLFQQPATPAAHRTPGESALHDASAVDASAELAVDAPVQGSHDDPAMAPALASAIGLDNGTSAEAAQVSDGASASMAGGLDLTGWAGDGAVALEARCPHQPGVQLALDGAGRLHVLAQAGASPRETAMDLLEVAHWAALHRPLLALTRRDLAWDVSADPQAHLFTDQPASAVALTRQAGPLVRVHLLQPMRVAGDIAWAASPLN